MQYVDICRRRCVVSLVDGKNSLEENSQWKSERDKRLFCSHSSSPEKKNNKIDFCILTFLLGHTQIQMGKVVEDDFVKDLNLNRKKSPKMI